MYESLLSAVAGGASGQGGGGSYGNEHDISTDTGLNINSVGLNLGSILQPFRDGNSNTGGYDLELLSRLGYTQPAVQTTSVLQPSGGTTVDLSDKKVWVVGGIAIVGVVLLMMKKKG